MKQHEKRLSSKLFCARGKDKPILYPASTRVITGFQKGWHLSIKPRDNMAPVHNPRLMPTCSAYFSRLRRLLGLEQWWPKLAPGFVFNYKGILRKVYLKICKINNRSKPPSGFPLRPCYMALSQFMGWLISWLWTFTEIFIYNLCSEFNNLSHVIVNDSLFPMI